MVARCICINRTAGTLVSVVTGRFVTQGNARLKDNTGVVLVRTAIDRQRTTNFIVDCATVTLIAILRNAVLKPCAPCGSYNIQRAACYADCSALVGMEVGEQTRAHIQAAVGHIDCAAAAGTIVARINNISQGRTGTDIECTVGHADQTTVFTRCNFDALFAAAVQNDLGQRNIAVCQRKAVCVGPGCGSIDRDTIPHAGIGEVCIAISRRGERHRRIRERDRRRIRNPILIHQLLHRRRCGRGRMRDIRIESLFIGVEGLVRISIADFSEIPIHGGSAVCVIQQVSIFVRDFEDTADEGDRTVIVNGVNGKASGVAVSVGIVRGVRHPVRTGDHQLCPVRHMEVLRLACLKGEGSLTVCTGDDTVVRFIRILIKGIVCPRRIVICQRHSDIQAGGKFVFHRYDPFIPSRLRPDCIECNRRGHFGVKIVCLIRDIFTRRMILLGCKVFILRPAEERNILCRGIDRIWIRTLYCLAAVYGLLINLAVAVPVVVAVHLRRPPAAVDVETDQRLLGKGDGGIGNTVTELTFYFIILCIIYTQNGRIRSLVEGGLIVDGVVIPDCRHGTIYRIGLLCSHAGLMGNLQYGRLTRFNAQRGIFIAALIDLLLSGLIVIDPVNFRTSSNRNLHIIQG